jgi:hypothetical protein
MKLTSTFKLALGLVFALGTAVAYAVEKDEKPVAVADGATGTDLTLERVTVTEDSLVVIHGLKPGGDKRTPDPDVVIGFVAVKAGESTNVKVPLDQPLAAGRYLAVLYVDAGEVGRFEPGTDKPAVNAEGKLIADRFKAK